ncbi:MAG: hypothetical protein DRJ26_04550 [Candidatus Methanomethylicota archaeon]|uniref:Uncharacterized protein n=1 Tax=Thermoproteota archaeon TaxID=2056631 RepID=A0A497EZD0_9CREN|nr:MAG: hypothetical protein DRJ26_04550 [Candidatus Verstraetearchaeota archaeon]
MKESKEIVKLLKNERKYIMKCLRSRIKAAREDLKGGGIEIAINDLLGALHWQAEIDFIDYILRRIEEAD